MTETPNERQQATTNRLLSVLLIAAAVLSVVWRVIPHIPNTTPVGALGLFSGARLRWWQAALLSLLVMAVSDAVLYQMFAYSPFSAWVYGSLLVNVLIGAWLSRWGALWCVGAGGVLASLQFYLVTNFGEWMRQGPDSLYPPTMAGLLDCYVLGLPFFGRTLAGDLCFTALLFGAYAVLSRHAALKEAARLEAVNVPLVASRER
jgi:hypothetical protein